MSENLHTANRRIVNFVVDRNGIVSSVHCRIERINADKHRAIVFASEQDVR
jgi:hypothetical protein